MIMYRRAVGVYCVLLLLLTVAIFRIYQVGVSPYAAMASHVQGRYALSVASARGVIYDRNMQRLVNHDYGFVASVVPTPQSLDAIIRLVGDDSREELVARFQSGMPFAMRVPRGNLHARGIDVFRVPQRYSDDQIAVHLIGYLGSGGRGVAGIERAFNDVLLDFGTTIETVYHMDAIGHLMTGGATEVRRTGEEMPMGGVVLTLDTNIQLITQRALASGAERGAAVVLDVHTGDILAMASLPDFDPRDIAASLERDDAPFINRATSGYSIGSAFKTLMSAAALEAGFTRDFRYVCSGYVNIGGRFFRCNNYAVHGDINMTRAMEVSCNTYFIDLGMRLDPRFALTFMENMGLGSADQIAPGMYTQSGNLPLISEFAAPAAAANFSFGQGSSLATPLQMASTVAVIANGGRSVEPRLVKGITPDGLIITQPTPVFASNQIISERTAREMREILVAVVETGSGRPARPIRGSAGGKTSSAQTGRFDDDGVEEVHAWFAGFYPAENPRYSIVVFVEGGVSGERVAAPIFRQIADGIAGVSVR